MEKRKKKWSDNETTKEKRYHEATLPVFLLEQKKKKKRKRKRNGRKRKKMSFLSWLFTKKRKRMSETREKLPDGKEDYPRLRVNIVMRMGKELF